ncbi:hypothetical protein ANN_07413 [Periplaneta americana]|uniref:Ionotropic receptor 75a N-terminal domain-containing protein n=1 Tax=Periplaneta americana TaxID=6978 RepID=A0ABQ8T059_PERAM|nr:hypothetical protein ANN_07413 [Periplaneta americana]
MIDVGATYDANALKITKSFMGKGVRVKIQNIDEPMTMSSLLSVDYYKLAVILDWQCERGSYILKEASKNNLFSMLHFWLVFLDNAAEDHLINNAAIETNGTWMLSSEDQLLSELESLLILLNSQFTLVRSGSQQDQFLLQDVYRILPRLPLIFTPLQKWSPGQKYPDSPKRNDFGGITLQSATVILGVWREGDHVLAFDSVRHVLLMPTSESMGDQMRMEPGDIAHQACSAKMNNIPYKIGKTTLKNMRSYELQLDIYAVEQRFSAHCTLGLASVTRGEGTALREKAESDALAGLKVIEIGPATSKYGEDIWEQFMDPRYKHINSFTKKGYALSERLATYHNFKLNITPMHSWGFPINVTATEVAYDGVVGLLYRREIDMTSTGLIFKLWRIGILDYSGEIGIFEGRFIFLKPSLSDISNIYTLPFTPSVWLTYFVVLAILTVAMFIVQNTESRMNDSDTTEPMSIPEAVITSISVVCQEGELVKK